jgi:hypothetical protein
MSKNSQVLKNYKQLSIATLLAFGSCLLMISGSAVAPVAYGRSHAEGVIKADTSHVAQSLIYLPQVIRTH